LGFVFTSTRSNRRRFRNQIKWLPERGTKLAILGAQAAHSPNKYQ
jgi:hypothetical protein